MSARTCHWLMQRGFVTVRMEHAMYKFDYDFLYGRWNVFFVHDGKEDFQCSFTDVQDAHDYCDMKNGALVSVGGG